MKAEGISNYSALQLQARKRLSYGSDSSPHPTPGPTRSTNRAAWASSLPATILSRRGPTTLPRISIRHTFSWLITATSCRMRPATKRSVTLVNGWMLGGQTVAQSGQPYSVYDYSGSVASLYFGTSTTSQSHRAASTGGHGQQAQLQGTTGVNAGKPVLNANDFAPQFVAPGTNGVPLAMPRAAISTNRSTQHRPEYVPRTVPGSLRHVAGQGISDQEPSGCA